MKDPMVKSRDNVIFLGPSTLKQLALMTLLAPAICLAQAQNYTISTIAGTGTSGFTEGSGVSAQLNFPLGIAFSDGSLLIADQLNQIVRRMNLSTGAITPIAGTRTLGSDGETGAATAAQLQYPVAVTPGPNGVIYFSDFGNNTVRAVSNTGSISPYVSRFSIGGGLSGDGGQATDAQINRPYGLAVAADGTLYMSDNANNRIRRIGPDGIITTYAGYGEADYSGDNGPAVNAALNHPSGLAVDAAGNLYIADTNNHVIRRVDAQSKIITTVAGNGIRGYAGDGGRATFANLRYPEAVTVDSAGNLYITDTSNHVIRRVLANSLIISTIAGNGLPGIFGDNINALQATLQFPRGIAVDTSGNVYIADTHNSIIRKLTPGVTFTGGPPAIAPNGITTADNYGEYGTAAGGTWIEIRGRDLAAANVSRTWTTNDFIGINAPTSLDNTRVTVGGQPAVILFASPGRVTALIPPGMFGFQNVVVSTAAGVSAPYALALSARQPEIFAPSGLNLGGTRYAAAFFSDGSIAMPASFGPGYRPARAGEIISLYAIGLGAVTPDQPWNQLSQTDNNTLVVPVRVFFGGAVGNIEAQVTYQGLPRNAVSLYRIDVKVPASVAGDKVPLNISQGGIPGPQTLFVAVTN